jgi:hypothetical protein
MRSSLPGPVKECRPWLLGKPAFVSTSGGMFIGSSRQGATRLTVHDDAVSDRLSVVCQPRGLPED